MDIVWIVIVGFVVGLLARVVMPGKRWMGFFLTAGLGIGGALIASSVGEGLRWYAMGQGASFIASAVGAVTLLAIYSLIANF